MTPNNFSNTSVATTLVSGIGVGDLSMTVADATGYPAVPFAVVIDVGSVANEEAVLVTAKAGVVWTISRAYDGTTAKVHSAGATVIHAALARDFRGLILGTREMSTALPANGDAVVWNNGASQWEPGAVSATPGGADTEVQFNDGGVFAGDVGLTYDKNTGQLTLTRAGVQTHRLSVGDQSFLDEFIVAQITEQFSDPHHSAVLVDPELFINIEDVPDPSLSAIGINLRVRSQGTYAPDYVTGLDAQARVTSDFNLVAITGLQFIGIHDGAGTAQSNRAIVALVRSDAGTVGEQIGVDIAADTSFGVVTQSIGLRVRDFAAPGAVASYAIYTGAGLVSFGDDAEFRNANNGPILIDRTTADRYRLYMDNGVLGWELV